MATKDLLISITAKDGASRVFQALGKSGQDAGRAVEQGADRASDALDDLNRTQDETGQSAVEMIHDVDRASDALGRDLPQGAGRAEQALNELDRAQDQAGQGATELAADADRAGTSLRDFGNAGQQVGAGLALLGTAFAVYATQARDNEIAIANLRRTYGEAADEFIALADSIQNTTIFSNDEAVQAAAIFGTLARNYDLTNAQIQQLIITSADLAAVNGVSLVDSATRVAAAIRGEGESAEALGLTMNQAAIDTENLTLTMSNAEAGAFRYNALMDQTAFATGAAADAAETGAGKWQRYGNEFRDLVQEFVAFTGPVGDVAAGLTTWGIEAGVAAAGAAQLVRGMRELSAASQGVGKLGMTFGLLTNPIVLVGAAVAGMTAIAVKNIADHDNAAKQLATTYEEVGESIRNLPLAEVQQGQISAIIGEVQGLGAAYDEMFARIAAGGDFQQQFITDTTGAITQQILTSQQMFDQAEAGILTLEQEAQAIQLINDALTAEGANVNALIPSIENAIAQHQLWIATNGQMGISGETLIVMLQQMADGADTWGEAIQRTSDDLLRFSDQITATEQALAGLISAGDQNIALIDQLLEMQPILDQIMLSIATFTRDGDLFWGLTTGSEGLTQLEADLNAVLTTTGTAGIYAQQAIENLNAAHQAGILSADEYAAAVHYLATVELPALENELIIAGYQIGRIATDLDAGVVSADAFGEALGLAAVEARSFAKDAGLVTEALHEDTEARNRNADAGRIQANALYEVADAFDAGLGAIRGWAADNAALTDQFLAMYERWLDIENKLGGGREDRDITWHLNIETDETSGRASDLKDQLQGLGDSAVDTAERSITAFDGWNAQLVETLKSVGLLDDAMEQLRAGGVVDSLSLDLAIDTNQANEALSGTFGTVVGQTNSWGQLTQAVADWSAELAHGYAGQTRLDNALFAGLITRSTYQKALEANHDIQQANASIEEDILRIQIKQMPVLAQLAQAQADYVDSVADLPPEQQLVALGYMDQAQAAKAMEVAQLAATASTKGQQQAVSAMITEMVAADPVLKAMLLDMGLISEGADGTITVNFDSAESATDAINNLNGTIEDLNALLANIFNIDTETDAPESTRLIEALTGAVNDIPTSKTVTITAIENVSSTAAIAREALALLDGYSVTTYINTVQTGTVKAPGLATGGTIPFDAQPVLAGIPRFAGGGTLALVGEFGPELVTLPTGSQVTNTVATGTRLNQAARRDGGGNIFNGPVTMQFRGDTSLNDVSSAAIRRGRR